MNHVTSAPSTASQSERPLLRLVIFVFLAFTLVCLTSCGYTNATREPQSNDDDIIYHQDYTISSITTYRDYAEIRFCLSNVIIESYLDELDRTNTDAYELPIITLQTGHSLTVQFTREQLKYYVQSLQDHDSVSIEFVSEVELSPPASEQLVGSTAYLFLTQDLKYYANLMAQENLNYYTVPTADAETGFFLFREEAITYSELSQKTNGTPILLLQIADQNDPILKFFEEHDSPDLPLNGPETFL